MGLSPSLPDREGRLSRKPAPEQLRAERSQTVAAAWHLYMKPARREPLQVSRLSCDAEACVTYTGRQHACGTLPRELCT